MEETLREVTIDVTGSLGLRHFPGHKRICAVELQSKSWRLGFLYFLFEGVSQSFEGILEAFRGFRELSGEFPPETAGSVFENLKQL